MSARLKIGSYIIDSAASSSTSSTTGVRMFSERPGIRWRQNRSEATVIVPIQIARDTLANFISARDELVDALTKTVQADVVLESAAGTDFKHWKVSTAEWQRVECDIEVEDEVDNGNEVSALAVATITVSRIAPSSGSAGDPDGLLDGMTWDFVAEASGRSGGIVANAMFQTIAKAAAWVQDMRSGDAWPDWIDTSKTRFASAAYKPQQQPNQDDPPAASGYTPVPVVVYLTVLPTAWASDSAFDDVVDGTCEMGGRPRSRLQLEAGARPGIDILFSGRLQFKVDDISEIETGDAATTTAGQTKEKALACIRVMKTDLETRRGIDEVELVDGEEGIEIKATGRSGEVIFTAVGVAEFDGIFEFSDDVAFEETSRDLVLTGSKGDVVMESKLGPMVRAVQNGVARANFEVEPTPPPFIDETWFREVWRPRRPVVKPPHAEDGMTIYETSWEGRWMKLATANGGGFGGGAFNDAGYFIPTSPDT